MDSKSLIEQQYNNYKKKKNAAVAVVSFSFVFVLTVGTWLFLQQSFDQNLAYTILFILLFAYLVFIVFYRSKIVLYAMKFHYFRMIHENVGLIKVNNRIYTAGWLKKFVDGGFEKAYEDDDFVLFVQFFNKIPRLGRTGRVLVCFVVSKTIDYNFYNNKLDEVIETVYDGYKDQKKVKKQIVIQYKKYDSFSEEHQEELQEIINFKNGSQLYINLPVGYFVDEQKIYYLRPIKQYPNKFYFHTCALIEQYSNLKGVVIDE